MVFLIGMFLVGEMPENYEMGGRFYDMEYIRDLDVGDVNQDGIKDLIAINEQTCFYRITQRVGEVGVITGTVNEERGIEKVEVVDLSKDGREDFVLFGDSILVIYYSYLGDSVQRRVVDSSFVGGYDMDVGDINGDGKLDIVASTINGIYWYDNEKDFEKQIIKEDARFTGLLLCNFDLDEDVDVIAHNMTQGKIYCYSNNQNGKTFEEIEIGGCLYPVVGFLYFDVDEDRDNDLIVYEESYGMWLFKKEDKTKKGELVLQISGGRDLELWERVDGKRVLLSFQHERGNYNITGVFSCSEITEEIKVESLFIDSFWTGGSDSIPFHCMLVEEFNQDLYDEVFIVKGDTLLYYRSIKIINVGLTKAYIPHFVDADTKCSLKVGLKNWGTTVVKNIPIQVKITTEEDPFYLYVDTERKDSIYPGDSLIYSFSPPWEVPTGNKHYSILFVIAPPEDTFYTNDTLKYEVEVRGEVLVIGERLTSAQWDTLDVIFGSFFELFDKWDVDSNEGYPDSIGPWKVIVLGTNDYFAKLDSTASKNLVQWLLSGERGMFGFGSRFLWDITDGDEGDTILGKMFNTYFGGIYPNITPATYLCGVKNDPITGNFDSLVGNFNQSEYMKEGGEGIPIFTYGDGDEKGKVVGTRYENASLRYKTVWLGFNILDTVVINNPEDRNGVFSQIIKWLKLKPQIEEEETKKRGNFKIFPNPFYDELCLEIKCASLLGKNMKVYDLSGRLIASLRLPLREKTYRWGRNLKEGIYFFDTGGRVIKVVKIK